MANDSKFEVRIEQRMFNKGEEVQVRREWYEEWGPADAAYCAYKALTEITQSSILHVELIEHRQRLVHKASSKEAA